MELIADGILILAAFVATAYCIVLSRRLRRLSEMDGGLGAAITSLSREVDHLSAALSEAKAATTESASDLGAQCRAAHIAARRLETLVKSANLTGAPNPFGSATPPPVAEAPKQQAAEPTEKASTGRPSATKARKGTKSKPQAEALPGLAETAEASPPQPDLQRALSDKAPPEPAGKPVIRPSSVAPTVPRETLDQFIGAIMAKGDDAASADLARRLVRALTADAEGAAR